MTVERETAFRELVEAASESSMAGEQTPRFINALAKARQVLEVHEKPER